MLARVPVLSVSNAVLGLIAAMARPLLAVLLAAFVVPLTVAAVYAPLGVLV